ncbi:MAG: helix-turn-helix transcriptional regulator [Clostridia bacterium]|nr:helix-turn-helix transcriptional regulator [Clostridia bacterium]
MYMLKRLRDIREDRDLKQKNIAYVLGISIQQYQLYESGKRELPVRHLKTLCKFYHVSSDYILELTNDPEPK